ncbi:hypothetical protein K9N68_05815 [Kovacikia minuta CCNUW1]|uniref:hypothetical protein n=1 Tax=Kovacikia minuta TaxID=2931930 RepID=UPI001CCFED92|nr:hypothetical protein [Kovacikia minuta]UBF27461.1 hypothetical protein K9N68_05815 [Kovacikia minuta CCNUW1]
MQGYRIQALTLDLESTKLIWVGELELTTAKAILERIRERAIARWGEEKWLLELVREYCKIMGEGTVRTRKSQIERVFEVGSCTVDTAIALAAAVGCRFQMACMEIIDL